MALVPNGRLRNQVKQGHLFNSTVLTAQSQQVVNQDPEIDPRLEIEQQYIGTDQSDETDLDQDDNNDSSNLPQDNTSQPDLNISKNDSEDSEPTDTEMKETWRKMLEDLGVPSRTLDNNDKKLYSEQRSLNDNTLKGHYMIPTYTAKGKVTYRQAMELARQLQDQFGLSSIIKDEGKNWRVDFSTQPKVENQDGGTSFDLLNQSQEKTASTLGEMLKERQNILFETMKKIANGRS